MHICPIWTNGLYFGHQPDHCEKSGEARTFFSQWSPRISQQHGIANVMTTNHCENHVRFFSQWSGRMLPESEPSLKMRFGLFRNCPAVLVSRCEELTHRN